MTHAASLKVLTQRWVMSHLTRAQCCPVWVIAERERGRDTQILRTSPQLWGQDRGPDHHHDTETRDQPLPWHPGPSGWRPGPACVMLWSYRLLKYFTFQMRLSSQIAALASQSYSGGPGQCSEFSVRRTFLPRDWVTIIVPITCSLSPGPGHDGVWCVVTRPDVTRCTCHVCHQALSPALADNISTAHNILFSCSPLATPEPWSWYPDARDFDTQVVLALTSRPSAE